jgi:DNA-binding NtrC family response regulator
VIQNVLILADESLRERTPAFNKSFRRVGEYVEQLSHLYSIIRERNVDLILIPEDFPGINRGIIRRIRTRTPLTDIWQIVVSEENRNDSDNLYDGLINLNDGSEQISKKVKRILYQKSLLNKFGMVGRSGKMKIVAETIERIASTDISVLIIGPSGSGKELVARAIHDYSTRVDGRFVAINCGALAEGVLESELFGHEKGAFTGSVGKREGLFLRANSGTIFLDEIGETKPDIQVKLLRVLEDGCFYPVGGDKPVHSDARILAATNRDLSEAIHDGAFREDLYFRLGVVKIILPSLYDRRDDIFPLLYYFADIEGLKGFSDSALDLLLRYDWPGNVRQLRNFVARMAALHPKGEISAAEVEHYIDEQGMGRKNLPVVTGHSLEEAGHELIYHALISLGNEIKMLRDLIIENLPPKHDIEVHETEKEMPDFQAGRSIKEMEKELIISILKKTDGNRKAAAKLLGIGERTLYRKLKDYDLS